MQNRKLFSIIHPRPSRALYRLCGTECRNKHAFVMTRDAPCMEPIRHQCKGQRTHPAGDGGGGGDTGDTVEGVEGLLYLGSAGDGKKR
jgi:hypothetical protein